MKTFSEFVFKENDLKFLTIDMLNIHDEIATNKNIPHQQCIFPPMKYMGDMLFNELKKKKNTLTKIIKHLIKRFEKLTTHLREDNIDKT
ncbi:MAG: hypothetical protein LBV42_00140 [Methanobrevibacter sp.]|jgi:hypothetical protein|nr:hypothetical protein [Methanobrevibacter sp.]